MTAININHLRAIEVLRKRCSVDKVIYLNSIRSNALLARERYYRQKFVSHYRVIRKTPSFYESYFALLERVASTVDIPSIREILAELHKIEGECHLSFGSKLLATVDDEAVIFDRYVARLLGVKNCSTPKEGRMEKALRYAAIQRGIAGITSAEGWVAIEYDFDRAFQTAGQLSKTRKADLMVWASYVK